MNLILSTFNFFNIFIFITPMFRRIF